MATIREFRTVDWATIHNNNEREIMLKKADKKFKELGFNKVEDNEYFVHYERYVGDFRYTHGIDLLFKNSGKHIAQSYDVHLFDTKGIGNTNVGMTAEEMKLCIRKMKEKGWI